MLELTPNSWALVNSDIGVKKRRREIILEVGDRMAWMVTVEKNPNISVKTSFF